MNATATQRHKPLVLLIIDGFGIAPPDTGNAIHAAKTPVYDRLVQTYPAMPLRASGETVGLNWGDMGNSEVGHLTIGAGRVYYQSLPRINKAIEDGTFYKREAFLRAIEHVKKTGGTLHIVGLMSSGKVHAMNTHAYALLELAAQQKLKKVAVHAILDGRDTLYNAGYGFIEELISKMDEFGVGRLATIMGRHFAMDRDHKWDRTQLAYDAMLGHGPTMDDPLSAIKASYAKEVYDEQLAPTVVAQNGMPTAPVADGDAIIMTNYRPDRARQLTKAFTMPEFEDFERTHISDLMYVGMMPYETGIPMEVAFPPELITKGLSEIISNMGLKQLHVAETEKYAHVTFFFNGTREDPFAGEERVMVPSPKVASYDEVPEMSAGLVTDAILKAIRAGVHDVIIANYANPDMVAHTGNFEATKVAVEVVDAALGRIVEATLTKQGVVLVTADHGNAEEVTNLQTGDMDKEHSTNPVPFLIIGKTYEGQPSLVGDVPGNDLSLVAPVGVLADVAPTALRLLGIPQPKDMTGQALI
ncbi:phosphoglycerate mutase (2,3-diphosphoglycerate-independent) [Candidatus Uhrbacteria bacterium RIFCSPLOWO2_01_FULL_53_9]|uniref:2,3-bisphosphoglycerate-independent phosphoglycerate mutase n=3 Tax=Candidatus Uhriibacteriota TaxID=1752732 RepID=A0A1F7UZ08_9BACT|nr:MAG: phosphoglycerate mutase (2,3-diphosphoglycerate-independent) [Candidatus Uhrbacteria bacterium RIFCSPHIGHO2_02_FULL_53_13]OGL83512.1 MAG: phosphoglycerate mutase (2,3-diphosphoglycerate-independent) [Candidatus Uhrbacteria bacterium RIFCSPLOWO2_01_FULL_53_9]OGL89209.1 MAG: phosphoglycerate mutase (2,3-diphosphoglycerate-independent) [Candidatus Uhrbacteria bacterium RIFCSPLOWO2_02_FULL_53_10]